jgi:hypothetical protein
MSCSLTSLVGDAFYAGRSNAGDGADAVAVTFSRGRGSEGGKVCIVHARVRVYGFRVPDWTKRG